MHLMLFGAAGCCTATYFPRGTHRLRPDGSSALKVHMGRKRVFVKCRLHLPQFFEIEGDNQGLPLELKQSWSLSLRTAPETRFITGFLKNSTTL